jgi:hypothetical protein
MSCVNAHTEDVVGSCLSATTSRIGEGIKARANNLFAPQSVSVTDCARNHIEAICDVYLPKSVSVTDVIKRHLGVRCSIVCSLSEVVEFLNVTPADIQWITDDMGVFYEVESNVDWIIVTS